MTPGSRPVLLLVVVLSGCGTPDAGTGRTAAPATAAPTTPAPATAPPAAVTPAPSGGTELVVEARDTSGAPAVISRLRCDPPGGDHPRPRAACRDLAAAAEAAFAPPPADELCTQQYGGPRTARISGTYRGRPVDVRLERTDGCAIARWEALGDVLPPLD